MSRETEVLLGSTISSRISIRREKASPAADSVRSASERGSLTNQSSDQRDTVRENVVAMILGQSSDRLHPDVSTDEVENDFAH